MDAMKIAALGAPNRPLAADRYSNSSKKSTLRPIGFPLTVFHPPWPPPNRLLPQPLLLSGRMAPKPRHSPLAKSCPHPKTPACRTRRSRKQIGKPFKPASRAATNRAIQTTLAGQERKRPNGSEKTPCEQRTKRRASPVSPRDPSRPPRPAVANGRKPTSRLSVSPESPLRKKRTE